MEATKITNNHVLVTPPDRYWSSDFNILLVDVDWGQIDSIVNSLRPSSINLAIHVYTPHDFDNEWLLNVANSSNVVFMDLNQTTNNDILKGQLISKHNVWYTGRRDLEKIYPNYTQDPLALLLVEIEKTSKEVKGDQ
jgi:dolichyl-phosphate-mannose--protein O-mannosyl transferase